MTSFSKCPQCGLFEDRRTRCRCGYVAPGDSPASTPPDAVPPPPPTAKPGLLRRVLAVLLVVPIAGCLVLATKWQDLGLGRPFEVLPELVGQILVAMVGFALLGLANYLWTGKTREERTQR